MTDLNVGQGQCLISARLLVKPVRAAIELGALEDVLSTALRAVHHANRNGSDKDFIAIAFPTMRLGRNAMLPGHELELIGSPASLCQNCRDVVCLSRPKLARFSMNLEPPLRPMSGIVLVKSARRDGFAEAWPEQNAEASKWAKQSNPEAMIRNFSRYDMVRRSCMFVK